VRINFSTGDIVKCIDVLKLNSNLSRNAGVMKYWSVGVMEYWSRGESEK